MGEERFTQLRALLPSDVPILGIDEHTALLWNPADGRAEVVGKGCVHWLSGDVVRVQEAGTEFPLAVDWPAMTISPRAQALLADVEAEQALKAQPPDEVWRWVWQREEARKRRDWANADALRDRVAQAGWQIMDTPDGPRLRPRTPRRGE